MTILRPRREQRLDELVALFLAQGFRRFTLAELAAELHCSKSTLYAYGRSKEQLTLNVIRSFFKRSTAEVEAALPSGGSNGARLAAYLDAISRALRPASARFMEDLASHEGAREVYERNTEAAAERVRQIIAEGVVAGEFRDVHAAFVADTVAATMARIQGGAVRRALGLSDAEAYEELAGLVLDGIRG